MSLAELQSLRLDTKVLWAIQKISEALEYFDAQGIAPYISYSGGKDSTVLKHLVHSLRPDVPCVFVNTGLEYPEIVEFARLTPGLIELRPEMAFTGVLEKYGYPIVSKSVSMAISRYRGTKSDVQRQLRLYGGVNPSSGKTQSTGVIPRKYHYLVDAPFKISESCCDVMKKRPIHKFLNANPGAFFVGTLASDSDVRKASYLKHGCNAFTQGSPTSRPLSIWTEQDILRYIIDNNLPIAPVYGSVEELPDGTLRMTGEDRTGCIFCLFGIMQEQRKRGCNRFQRMHVTHPHLHKYCMNQLGIKNVMDYLGLPTEAQP